LKFNVNKLENEFDKSVYAKYFSESGYTEGYKHCTVVSDDFYS